MPGSHHRREVLFIAGDLSGDIYASRLAERLSERNPDLIVHALSGRRLGKCLPLGQAGVHRIRSRHILPLQGITGRLYTAGIDGLDLADVAQDRVELAGEAVDVVVGQSEAGQLGQPRDFVAGDRGHGG